jgi:hypothetical protein
MLGTIKFDYQRYKLQTLVVELILRDATQDTALPPMSSSLQHIVVCTRWNAALRALAIQMNSKCVIDS